MNTIRISDDVDRKGSVDVQHLVLRDNIHLRERLYNEGMKMICSPRVGEQIFTPPRSADLDLDALNLTTLDGTPLTIPRLVSTSCYLLASAGEKRSRLFPQHSFIVESMNECRGNKRDRNFFLSRTRHNRATPCPRLHSDTNTILTPDSVRTGSPLGIFGPSTRRKEQRLPDPLELSRRPPRRDDNSHFASEWSERARPPRRAFFVMALCPRPRCSY